MNKQKQKTLTITLANLVNKAKGIDSFIFNISNLQNVVDIPERLLFQAVEDTVSLKAFRQLVDDGVWLVAKISGVFVQFSKMTVVELDINGKLVDDEDEQKECEDCYDEDDDYDEDEDEDDDVTASSVSDEMFSSNYKIYSTEQRLTQSAKRAFPDNSISMPYKMPGNEGLAVIVNKNPDESSKDFAKKVQEEKDSLSRQLLRRCFKNVEISMLKDGNLFIGVNINKVK